MKLVYSHQSALELLRYRRSFGLEAVAPARLRTLEDCASSQEEMSKFGVPEPLNRSEVVHVMVPSRERQFHSKTHICHVWRSDPLSGSFYEVGDRTYAATPELLFVQMANQLDLLDLVLLGMELCGTYTHLLVDKMRFVNCPAATTHDKLEAFAKRAKGMRGATTALRALRWVIDKSNSPGETSLTLYLYLPVRLGGYGMPVPDMNPKTPLGKRASRFLGQDDIRCDLHWPTQRVVLEYASSQEHLKPSRAARDAERSNTLGYKKLKLITATPKMIARPPECDAMVKQLASALGKRPSPDAFLLSKMRRDLRLRLFPWLEEPREPEYGMFDLP